MSETQEMLSIPGLVFTGNCNFVVSSGNLTVTLGASDSVIVSRDSGNGNISINSNSQLCQNANYANVKYLNLVSPSGSTEAITLDYDNGTFGVAAAATGSGTTLNMGGDANDAFAIRTLDSNTLNQNITLGAQGIYLTASNWNDVLYIQHPGVFTLALGAGNDTVRATGTTALGGPTAQKINIFGNAGADTFYTSGANFNDLYNAGSGNDTIYVAATVLSGAHHVFDGNLGIDTIDFSSRTLATKIFNSGTAVSGDLASGENVTVANGEVINGGSGPDLIQGGAAGTVTWLNGGPGNDNFIQAAAADSNDTISGGPGIDLVNYAQRTIAVFVTLDGNPNDGSVGEVDNVGLDVENIYTGSGGDLLVGDANSNVLDGGAGTNTIQGGAGDDYIQQSIVGTDTVACGAGTDTVDYSPRSTLILAALDGNTNSGFTGENDILGTDCENLNGPATGSSSANVTLTGNAGDNVIAAGGSAGAVTINCAGGEDIAVTDSNASNAPGAISNCEIITQ